jgi:hypothetical protein
MAMAKMSCGAILMYNHVLNKERWDSVECRNGSCYPIIKSLLICGSNISIEELTFGELALVGLL